MPEEPRAANKSQGATASLKRRASTVQPKTFLLQSRREDMSEELHVFHIVRGIWVVREVLSQWHHNRNSCLAKT